MKQNSIKSFFGTAGPALKKRKIDLAPSAAPEAQPPAAVEAEAARVAVAASAPGAAASTGGGSPPDSAPTDRGDDLFSSLNQEWRDSLSGELKKSYIKGLEQYVTREYKNATVFPPKSHIFAALNSCPLSAVKVVVLGQDPYHGPDQAHGLCFSVQKGIPPPPSLKNIYKELKSDITGFRVPSHGYLEQWSRQGVLMLNTTLTVRKGEPNSHAKRGWETFTDAIIRQVGNQEGVVFLLWGKPAQAKCEFIDRSKHRVITSSHPSPLGATKTDQPFIGSRCFSRCNQYLTEMGKAPINWHID